MSEAVEQLIEALLDPGLRASGAYRVADARGLIKLDAMENPYDWPAEIVEALRNKLEHVPFNRYPDPSAQALKARLIKVMGIDQRWSVLLGNGSDELIQILTMALAVPGGTVMALAPSFVMFGLIARWMHVGFEEVALGQDFELDLPVVLQAIAVHQPCLTFLASPNNPTGNLLDEASIRAVLEASGGLVVIDEAYSAFTARNHLALLAEYPNLLVMRTLSKLGLASLRLGYLIGDRCWIDQLDKLRLPYNIGTLNQLAAEAALDHYPLLAQQTALICAERARVYACLQGDLRLHCYPSEANFLLVRLPAGSAVAVHEGMRKRGVLVKSLHAAHPLLSDCVRLTIGSEAENERMLHALAGALSDQPEGRWPTLPSRCTR